MINDIEKIKKPEDIPPILLIFGKEEFLVKEAFQYILKISAPDESAHFNLDILNAEDTDISQLVDICKSFPLMADTRTVGIKNFQKLVKGRTSAKSDKLAPLKKYIENPAPTTRLIIATDDSSLDGLSQKKNKKAPKFPYNLIVDKYQWIEYPKVYENQLSQWVSMRIQKKGKSINKDAADMLIAQTNPSLREINNEIEKLLIYSREKKLISVEDVNFIVGANRNYNVFELQKAIGQKNLQKSLSILENMLAVQSQEIMIVSMLTRYFILLWKMLEEQIRIKDKYELARKIGISPFFLDEYKQAVRNYKPSELNRAISALANADLKLKSSAVSPIVVMQNLIVNIIGK